MTTAEVSIESVSSTTTTSVPTIGYSDSSRYLIKIDGKEFGWVATDAEAKAMVNAIAVDKVKKLEAAHTRVFRRDVDEHTVQVCLQHLGFIYNSKVRKECIIEYVEVRELVMTV